MVTLISTLILMDAIDIFLVGVTFCSLKNHFQWEISPKISLLILFLFFAFLDIYIFSLFYVLDVTYTIGNEEVAKTFDFVPNDAVINLFGFGFVEFFIWSIQAFLATLIGDKLIKK